MRSNVLFLFVSVLASVALASIPVPPSQDPWYIPPSGYENEPDGTILRSRDAPGTPGFLLFPASVKHTYQLLYKSTDDLNRSIATATTIFVPKNADYTKLVSFQIAEDSSFIDCAPSYALLVGSRVDGIISQVEFLIMQSLLNLGYVVNVPDYDGPRSTFTVGQVAGRTVLDSLRAALASNAITGINAGARIALWGYSGGSIASGWAAQLLPSHAPELKISGAAIGGVVPNISAVAFKVAGGIAAGLVPSGITGIANQYDEVAQIVQDNLFENRKSWWAQASQQCLVADLLSYVFNDVWETFFKVGRDIVNIPVVAERLKENTMGAYIPQFPMYLYHAQLDEIAPVEKVDELVNIWCSSGIASLEYHKDILNEHISEEIFGSAGALIWLKSVMEGSLKPQKGCKTTIEASQLFDPKQVAVLGAELVGVLLSLVGKPIGPASFA